jgi:hypothetical protein
MEEKLNRILEILTSDILPRLSNIEVSQGRLMNNIKSSTLQSDIRVPSWSERTTDLDSQELYPWLRGTLTMSPKRAFSSPRSSQSSRSRSLSPSRETYSGTQTPPPTMRSSRRESYSGTQSPVSRGRSPSRESLVSRSKESYSGTQTPPASMRQASPVRSSSMRQASPVRSSSHSKVSNVSVQSTRSPEETYYTMRETVSKRTPSQVGMSTTQSLSRSTLPSLRTPAPVRTMSSSPSLRTASPSLRTQSPPRTASPSLRTQSPVRMSPMSQTEENYTPTTVWT